MLKRSFTVMALFFVLQVPASADRVFVWTDAKGVKHFSNTGPSEATVSFEQKEELTPAANPGGQPARHRSGPVPQPGADSEPAAAAEPPPADTETDPDAEYLEATRLDLALFPMPQGEIVRREKSIMGDLQDELRQGGNRQQIIDREKKRLALAVQDLDAAPLDKFGSQKNKRRQVGYFKYRLEKLLSDPDGYFAYPESESD
ncbi:MAG: DUF4124 domain-containing protein [Desulfobacterales bacterium]